MFYKNIFRQPYLDSDKGTEIGGGVDTDNFELDVDTTESVDEPKEPTAESTEDTKPVDESVKESPKVKLKYNHEEKEYSLDDVVPLAQKGLNYDKLQEKFNEIQNNPALSKYSKVQEVSALLGYQSDDEMLDALYNSYYERKAESEGLTPAQIRKEHELSQKEKAVAEKEQTLTKQEQDKKMYADFATNFPDVKAEMIKPETWAKVASGMDLSVAYTYQQNQELMNELKTLKQNASNSKRAPIGGVSTHGSDMTKHDAFLDGFDEN